MSNRPNSIVPYNFLGILCLEAHILLFHPLFQVTVIVLASVIERCTSKRTKSEPSNDSTGSKTDVSKWYPQVMLFNNNLLLGIIKATMSYIASKEYRDNIVSVVLVDMHQEPQ